MGGGQPPDDRVGRKRMEAVYREDGKRTGPRKPHRGATRNSSGNPGSHVPELLHTAYGAQQILTTRPNKNGAGAQPVPFATHLSRNTPLPRQRTRRYSPRGSEAVCRTEEG